MKILKIERLENIKISEKFLIKIIENEKNITYVNILSMKEILNFISKDLKLKISNDLILSKIFLENLLRTKGFIYL